MLLTTLFIYFYSLYLIIWLIPQGISQYWQITVFGYDLEHQLKIFTSKAVDFSEHFGKLGGEAQRELNDDPS